MTPELIIATLTKLAPVLIEAADALHLNTDAANLLRRVGTALIADAKKTDTPIDDAIASMLNAALDSIADLIAAGNAQNAVALLGALGKLAK